MLTLLAVLCWVRAAEITDALVDLLIETGPQDRHTHGPAGGKGADQEPETGPRQRGHPVPPHRSSPRPSDDIVREAPVSGGRGDTLQQLVKQANANNQVFQARVRTVLCSSYSNHYRRMPPALPAALNFRCHNTAYQPDMVATELLQRYPSIDGRVRFYDTYTLPRSRMWPRRRGGRR
ncbi:hypothetical protein [Nocardia sp. NPDC047038]|uniref:hypothetical protein n=1 Tax=Nocardia sp. NPDC047038 TaxID=3154338 RepID=UPI0033C66D00